MLTQDGRGIKLLCRVGEWIFGQESKNLNEVATRLYFNGQNLIFLLLVSETLTIPVGFSFYEPDPKMTAWRKEEKRLKEKERICKSPLKFERVALSWNTGCSTIQYQTLGATNVSKHEAKKKGNGWF